MGMVRTMRRKMHREAIGRAKEGYRIMGLSESPSYRFPWFFALPIVGWIAKWFLARRLVSA